MKRLTLIVVCVSIGIGMGLFAASGSIPGVSAQTAVTDAQAIRWTNETVRPLAEEYRALNIRSEQALAEWYAGMNAKIPNDTGEIEDGREAEGVSRLTGADINSIMGQVAAFVAQNDGAGVSDVINKPCVRRLEVN